MMEMADWSALLYRNTENRCEKTLMASVWDKGRQYVGNRCKTEYI